MISHSGPSVGFDFSRGIQRQVYPHHPCVDSHKMDMSLPWKPGDDIVLERIPNGLKDSAGGAMTRIRTNVAWSCHSGSAGFEWGYIGSGPGELAINILNQIVPPGTDGFRPTQRQSPYWAQHTSNQISKTALCLSSEFEREVISKLPQAGARISGKQIEQWISARLEQVKAARVL